MTGDLDVLTAIRASARQIPDALAISSSEGSIDFAELVRRADVLAAALAATGIGAGDHVAIHRERSTDLIVALLGTLACGAAYLPLDPDDPPTRLEHVLADARPRCLIGDATGASLASQLGIAYLDPAAVPTSPAAPMGVPEGTDPAYIIYTSGSTGAPKGVVVEHGSLRRYLQWALAELPWTGGGVPLFASASFDHAVTCYLAPLMAGEAVHLLPPLEGGRALASALLCGRHYSFVKITPSHARLLAADERAQLGLSTDLVMFGGERLGAGLVADVRRDAPRLRVLNHYGPTEATVGCCVYVVPEVVPSDMPIGRPLPGVEVLVVEDDVEVVPGEPGELLVGGDAPARGYLHRDRETRRAFVSRIDHPGRWYRTGDVVRVNAAGDLEYLGRRDDQVKVLGRRIEPGEVERTLRTHPGVRDAIVVVAPGEHPELVAAVVSDGAPLDVPELRAHLRAALPPAMVPPRIGLLTQLPVSASGKVDRTAVLAAIPARDVSGSSLAERVATKVAQLLGLGSVGLDDDFFELGGDSLAAVELVVWAEQHVGRSVETSALFGHPTPRELAAHLAQPDATG